MIYSKKHNFLFLKGVKVAGTSVEITLSKICGNKDIITPIANIDERTRVQANIRHAQNYGPKKSDIKDFIQWLLQVPTEQITSRQAPKGIVNNHMPLKRIYKKLDELHPEIKQANIFAVIRSPYEQILSRVNHKVNFKGYKTSGETMHASQGRLRQELDNYIAKLRQRNLETYRSKNFQIYDSSFDESIHVQFIRFENLKDELNYALTRIGVKADVELPFTKKGLQSSNDLFKEVATHEQIKIINDYHKNDFIRFGYGMINPT
uniref:sulfotransferase family 2 domain-containing protein n=1 Tax=Synechococcus sp. UW106 TaxID=368495 RepID=UPI000E0E80B5|nr:sulfotransferase family 2 domain-containing protein [Synechococcus sp. UW106]